MPTLPPPPGNVPHRITIMYPAEYEGFDVTQHPKFLKFLFGFMIFLLVLIVSLIILLQIPREWYPEWFKERMGRDWVEYKNL